MLEFRVAQGRFVDQWHGNMFLLDLFWRVGVIAFCMEHMQSDR